MPYTRGRLVAGGPSLYISTPLRQVAHVDDVDTENTSSTTISIPKRSTGNRRSTPERPDYFSCNLMKCVTKKCTSNRCPFQKIRESKSKIKSESQPHSSNVQKGSQKLTQVKKIETKLAKTSITPDKTKIDQETIRLKAAKTLRVHRTLLTHAIGSSLFRKSGHDRTKAWLRYVQLKPHDINTITVLLDGKIQTLSRNEALARLQRSLPNPTINHYRTTKLSSCYPSDTSFQLILPTSEVTETQKNRISNVRYAHESTEIHLMYISSKAIDVAVEARTPLRLHDFLEKCIRDNLDHFTTTDNASNAGTKFQFLAPVVRTMYKRFLEDGGLKVLENEAWKYGATVPRPMVKLQSVPEHKKAVKKREVREFKKLVGQCRAQSRMGWQEEWREKWRQEWRKE